MTTTTLDQRVSDSGEHVFQTIPINRPDQRTPAALRKTVTETLAGLKAFDEDTVDNAGLITSELVTNAVRHAPGPLTLTYQAPLHGPGELRIDVRDTRPDLGPAPADPERGLGLRLIELLTGHAPAVTPAHGGGKHITAILPIRGASCP